MNRVLTGHCVYDKERFDRVDGFMEIRDLVHHFVVNCEAPGSIHQQNVTECGLRIFQGAINDIDRSLIN